MIAHGLDRMVWNGEQAVVLPAADAAKKIAAGQVQCMATTPVNKLKGPNDLKKPRGRKPGAKIIRPDDYSRSDMRATD